MPTGHNQPVPNPDATISRGSSRRRLAVGATGALALVALASCGSSGSSSSSPDQTSSTSTSSTAATSTSGSAAGSSTSSTAPSAGPNGVNIVDYAFAPKTLTVAVGTTVTWKNLDQFAHEVRSAAGDPGTAFDLGPQSTGKTVSQTFATPGTYHYYCNIHNYMTGTIVVTP